MKRKNQITKLLSLFTSFMMIISMFTTNAYAHGQGQEDWNGPGSSTTVDHIDIEINATAVLVLNDKTYTQDVTLNTNDFANVQISSNPNVSFNTTRLSTSTDNQGKSQVRIEGTFPVGTKNSPVQYTVSIRPNVTFVDAGSITVPVTLSASFNYWDTGNACPGLDNSRGSWQSGSIIHGSGMDFTFAAGQSNRGLITIQKKLVALI
ncbi:hypothetical protein [Floccifex sp.]|uniref:hypothetical protein n=1 Tax=Floccifex sp. TaxID=2815810 RepID=UPI002A75242B|nr:hypothetical protein [Floccifex sp.]MDD7282069.1 hypothetical protein [Erysipelotrichaceae bacterium]MDY2958979.1 hypothetical protein [Floccifex sp.]